MNIVLESDNMEELRTKYTVLELDSFMVPERSQPVRAFCVIENLPIDQMIGMTQYIDLHDNLIKNYRLRNWKFCQDAIEHLMGKWGGQVDSFYRELYQRIDGLKDSDLSPEWDGSMDRTHL